MFSGIIESVQPIISSEALSNAHRIFVQRPPEFDDVKLGDSIACNGVCLTVEGFTSEQLQFVLAAETLKILNWNPDSSKNKLLNLERSLRFGDRIHGHLVTGHVDGLGKVIRSEADGASWFLDVKVPKNLCQFIWKKGSITLHGTSLTVNDIETDVVSVCLIPETIKRTNLGHLKPGDVINVEGDYFAKSIQQALSYRDDILKGNHHGHSI